MVQNKVHMPQPVCICTRAGLDSQSLYIRQLSMASADSTANVCGLIKLTVIKTFESCANVRAPDKKE